tara:strand:- start:656 stop:1810 length:1155 start_codon:yes stop_codon:yes gene_type:complete
MTQPNEKITCQICGAKAHVMKKHLEDAHPEITIEKYRADYPDAPLFSELAKKRWLELQAKRNEVTEQDEQAREKARKEGFDLVPFNEVFGIPDGASKSGRPIMLKVSNRGEFSDMVPAQDPNYIFDIGMLKAVCMGLELNIPTYLWGHTGTGKTTMLEQVLHHLKLPMLRIQHTINTEECQIVGQLQANEQGTYFAPGPLALAMRNGWTYLADEYDAAMPAVLLAYQPVLEGKPLVIKDADEEWRVINPHPNFRFLATGNTNGSGDETGLYAGTQIQNAANYSRFGIVENVPYMPASQEKALLISKCHIEPDDADKLVRFANDVRRDFAESAGSNPIGQRELIFAGMIGIRRGDFHLGLRQAFINKLPETSRVTCDNYAQRLFG